MTRFPPRARRPRVARTVALVAVVALAGCIGALDADEFEAELEARRADIAPDVVGTGLSALEAELGTAELRFARITFDLPVVTYWVPADPGDSGPAEAWRWDGVDLAGPSPVPAEATADLEETFSAADVPALDRVDQLGDEAVRAAALDGGAVSGVLVAHREGGLRIVVAVRAEDGGRRHVTFFPGGELEGVADG